MFSFATSLGGVALIFSVWNFWTPQHIVQLPVQPTFQATPPAEFTSECHCQCPAPTPCEAGTAPVKVIETSTCSWTSIFLASSSGFIAGLLFAYSQLRRPAQFKEAQEFGSPVYRPTYLALTAPPRPTTGPKAATPSTRRRSLEFD